MEGEWEGGKWSESGGVWCASPLTGDGGAEDEPREEDGGSGNHSQVMGERKMSHERRMRTQSLTTPARFIVSALVLPTNRKTQTLSPNASAAFVVMCPVDHVHSSSSCSHWATSK